MFDIYFTHSDSTELAAEYRIILQTLRKHGSEIYQTSSSAAQIMIVEVTDISSKVRTEIVDALSRNMPVLALLQAGREDKISPLFTGKASENLFVEYYHTGNVEHIITDFLEYVDISKKRKGKLIVIEGADASGKTTQAKLLVEYLKKHNISTKYVDFPQYYSSFHGKTVAKFLRGEFGNIGQVSPYLASLSYALDRASVKREMEEFLQSGGIIVANRYATSNMAYQGAKFLNEKDREEYLEWDYTLEYKVNRIPKEDIVIYLFVTWQIATDLSGKRGSRAYLKGKKDIHEEDIEHIKNVENMYEVLQKRYKHWVKVNSVNGNTIDSVESIHEKILAVLKEKKIIIPV